MVPLVGLGKDSIYVKARIDAGGQGGDEGDRRQDRLSQVGTMIELPRAALLARDRRDRRVLLLRHQRPDPDDLRHQPRRCGLVPGYLYRQGHPRPVDPFVSLDIDGVGELVKMAAERGRKTRPTSSSASAASMAATRPRSGFCESVGLDYVSCSPFRVPIARLAAAQAALGLWRVSTS
jgi:pyruvate,orthophosphate dikinase